MPTRSRAWSMDKRLAALDRWDQRVFYRLARTHSPTLDAILPRLTHVADHCVLWLGLTGGAKASGDRSMKRAGAHYPSDVLAGAALGTACAAAVARIVPVVSEQVQSHDDMELERQPSRSTGEG